MASNAAPLLRRALAVLLLTVAAPAWTADPAAEDPDPGVTAKDRAKWRLAIQTAARQALDNLESLSVSNAAEAAAADLVERLNAYMLQNAAGCRTDAQARQVCWWAIREVKRAEFQAAVSNAAAAAQEFSPLPVEPGSLFAKLGPGWSARVDAAIGLFLTNRFETVYTAARGRAVALQRHAVEAAVRFPDQAELEARLGQLAELRPGSDSRLEPADFDALKPWLAGRFAPDPSLLFEETAAYLGDLGGRMLEEIKAQYAFQVGLPENMVRSNAVPSALITAEALDRLFQDALDRAVAGARAARARMAGVSNIPVYEVLESARRQARSAARRLEQERVMAFLRDTPSLAPPDADLESALKREPEAHRAPAASLARLQADWSVSLRARAAAEYVRRTDQPPRPEAEAAELRLYFEREFAGTSAVAVAFQKRVADDLGRALPPLRERLAADQFQEFFPVLASEAPLPERGLEAVLDRKRASARTLDQVAALLEAAGLTAPSEVERRRFLDETGARAVAVWNRKAADACAAFDAQAALLRQIETNGLAQLERDVAADRPVEDILKDWTRALEQAWASRPADEAPGFPILFARTRAALDKTVRQLYDARRQERDKTAAAATASAAPPAQGIPTTEVQAQPEDKADDPIQPPAPMPTPVPVPKPETAAPEPEEAPPTDARAVADVVLVFSDVGAGQCKAAWTVRDPAVAGEILFDPAEIELAVAAFLAAFQPDLDRVLDARASRPRRSFLFFTRSAPDLRFSVSVKSRAVRHQMSLLLRQEIGRLADEWARGKGLEGVDVSLSWKVGL